MPPCHVRDGAAVDNMMVHLQWGFTTGLSRMCRSGQTVTQGWGGVSKTTQTKTRTSMVAGRHHSRLCLGFKLVS